MLLSWAAFGQQTYYINSLDFGSLNKVSSGDTLIVVNLSSYNEKDDRSNMSDSLQTQLAKLIKNSALSSKIQINYFCNCPTLLDLGPSPSARFLINYFHDYGINNEMTTIYSPYKSRVYSYLRQKGFVLTCSNDAVEIIIF